MFRSITGVRIASIIGVKLHLEHDTVVGVQGSDILCLSVTLHVAAGYSLGTMTFALRCVTLTGQ
jgi:hypothetical protein